MTPVIVTTDKDRRGVFFGYLDKFPAKITPQLTLKKARMLVYWDAKCHGVVGIAQNGVNANCRVSFASPRLIVDGVTSIMECTKKAAKTLEDAPWS